MMSFFRRLMKSWVVGVVLALIAGAIVVTGIGTPGGLTGGGAGGSAGETIATMDGVKIGAVEAERRIRDGFAQAQQQQPTLTMAAFVAGGGVEATLRRYVAAKAVEGWARRHGFTASKKLVDGEIASIAAFQGPTGTFDETVFRGVLARERVSEQQLREDIGGDAIRRQVLGPLAGGTQAGEQLVRPYAAMLLERREGLIGLVPTSAMPTPAAPSDADVVAYYKANLARFTMSERRSLRYALIGSDRVKGQTTPTEAEIADAYKADAAKHAPRTTRTLSQIVLPTEAAARAALAKIRAGTDFATVAQAAGFAPGDTALGELTQDALARLASPAVAAAAFALPKGGTTDVQRSPLGFHIVHVTGITETPATPLSAVRGEIVATITKRKTEAALKDYVARIDAKIGDGSTLDEAAAANQLSVVKTPPLLATGEAPGVAGWKPDPRLAPLLKVAFQAAPGDEPTVESIGPDAYALLALGDVLPAAPVPLAQIRSQLVAELTAQRAAVRARQVADAIVAKVAKGLPLATAFAQAGMPLPAPRAASGRQIDLAGAREPVPAPLARMFTMAPGTTKLVAAPDNAGWFVVRLDRVAPGDLKTAPQLVAQTRAEFGRVLGDEYADQFIAAIARDMNVKQDAAAVARLKATLLQTAAVP